VSLPPVELAVSGERFAATYRLHGPLALAAERAEAIAVEQTIEFPADLVGDDDIRRHVIGRVEAITAVDDEHADARISYAVETTGFELPQLLNVLFGNCSLLPGLRIVGLEFPDPLLARFPGPRFGMAGLRKLVGAGDRPLLASALKPMGLSAAALATMAGAMARGGIDVIKDDHGIANQVFAPFRERVQGAAAAVAEANTATGGHCLYLATINGPADEVADRARFAKEVGAGGVVVLPGLAGHDTIRMLAADPGFGLPIMAHPAFMGSLVTSDEAGIEHGLAFGTLARLAGADCTVFPNYGGRFSFSTDACTSIADACLRPLGPLRPILPAPGGGMTVGRIPELIRFYGSAVMLLVGGNLSRGNLHDNARRMREATEAAVAGGPTETGGSM
jgi:ribulose-bisphosphate carboxylase large chain